uniref:Uncharacterized protein n=1 Tax=Arundo donax TaxID=35708 RepID=A0A0A9B1B4_ARUDO
MQGLCPQKPATNKRSTPPPSQSRRAARNTYSRKSDDFLRNNFRKKIMLKVMN